jgi:hypothetical protein
MQLNTVRMPKPQMPLQDGFKPGHSEHFRIHDDLRRDAMTTSDGPSSGRDGGMLPAQPAGELPDDQVC